jgi:hypothetical protein
MLLNLDIPLKRATLHNPFCSFVPKPVGTKLKPVGRMGDDGGWFHVATEADAAVAVRTYLPNAHLVRCSRC